MKKPSHDNLLYLSPFSLVYPVVAGAKKNEFLQLFYSVDSALWTQKLYGTELLAQQHAIKVVNNFEDRKQLLLNHLFIETQDRKHDNVAYLSFTYG